MAQCKNSSNLLYTFFTKLILISRYIYREIAYLIIFRRVIIRFPTQNLSNQTSHRMFKKNVAVWKMLKDLEDGPPFLCPKCGRTYSHKCNLTRHLRLECGVGPRFQCAWCKKRFKHRHHLRDHQRIHLYSNCTFELRN